MSDLTQKILPELSNLFLHDIKTKLNTIEIGIHHYHEFGREIAETVLSLDCFFNELFIVSEMESNKSMKREQYYNSLKEIIYNKYLNNFILSSNREIEIRVNNCLFLSPFLFDIKIEFASVNIIRFLTLKEPFINVNFLIEESEFNVV